MLKFVSYFGLRRPQFLSGTLRFIRCYSEGTDPLRVGFFGSDEFSVRVLQRLAQLKQEKPGLVSDLHVITRSPKRGGRNRKLLLETPIAETARQLGLPLKYADGKPELVNLLQENYNLLIAVSYGFLIPAELLKAAPFGGLNVHPSLLPRHSGAAPLQHTILSRDTETGVTVQTLHPTLFDRGEIVLQSDELPVSAEDNYETLRDRLAGYGAELLAETVAQRLFDADIRSRTERRLPSVEKPEKYGFTRAGKIRGEARELRFADETAEEVHRRFRALGSVYAFIETTPKRKRAEQNSGGSAPSVRKRVTFRSLSLTGPPLPAPQNPGEMQFVEEAGVFAIPCRDGTAVYVHKLQLHGYKEEPPSQFMLSSRKRGVVSLQLYGDSE